MIRTIAAAALLVAGVTPAWAHAFVESSSPADGATVTSPREAVVRFTETIELEFSTLAVKSDAGDTMSTGKVRQPAPNTLAIDVTPLPPGAYVIRWRVLSVDTHVTDGALRFTVGRRR